MKKDKFSLFNDQERKDMNMQPVAKPEDKFSLLDDKTRQEMGMAPRAKMEDNFSLVQEEKPSKFKELLGKLSEQGKKSASGLGKAVDVQAPEAEKEQSAADPFNPSAVKSAQFGNVNTIKPQDFDYETRLSVLRKLMGE